MGLSKTPRDISWEYKDDRDENLKTLALIIKRIKKIAFPVIEMFKANPNILELFEINDLKKFHNNWTKKQEFQSRQPLKDLHGL